MNRTRAAAILLMTVTLTACTPWPHTVSTSAGGTATTTRVAVSFTGGHDTDPRDGGRPVVLIAAALGVPAEVFRTAFSGVTPAAGGAEPEAEQVGRNKEALLSVLASYGVTNARLDEVSNYYRYQPGTNSIWPTRSAQAVATIRAGKVTAVTVTDGGAGYSSVPTVSIPGVANSGAVAALAFGTELATNGSVTAVRLR